MRKLLANLGTAALLSVLLVLPFLLLEWLTQSPKPGSRLSIVGIVYMWLVPTLAIFLVLPTVRTLRAGKTNLVSPVWLVLKASVVGILVWTWGEFMLDQWPCFIGATGC